jgi:hypothetical protein
MDYDNDLWVQSYDTIVGRIDKRKKILHELGKWSPTTSKHIKYVAEKMNLKLIPSKEKKEIK